MQIVCQLTQSDQVKNGLIRLCKKRPSLCEISHAPNVKNDCLTDPGTVPAGIGSLSQEPQIFKLGGACTMNVVQDSYKLFSAIMLIRHKRHKLQLDIGKSIFFSDIVEFVS